MPADPTLTPLPPEIEKERDRISEALVETLHPFECLSDSNAQFSIDDALDAMARAALAAAESESARLREALRLMLTAYGHEHYTDDERERGLTTEQIAAEAAARAALSSSPETPGKDGSNG